MLARDDLNRATLARQMLLERSSVGVVDAVQRLAGMQAQEPKHPFVGLWTRLQGFDEAALRAALLEQRSVVRATLMRSTLHLVSAADYAALRPALQPPAAVALRVLGARSKGLEVDRVLPAARELLAGTPLTFDEIRARLVERFPDVDERALGYAVRTLVPLVMVPREDERWGFGRGRAQFTLAEEWLGERLAEEDASARALVRRYLGAFGPASATDAGAWSGIGGMTDVLDAMRDELDVFTDSRGRELFDLPGAPRPGAAAAAPPRLLPQFDNLMLAWDDRSRVIAGEHRPRVTTKNLRVRATFLVDGRVAGVWTIALTRRVATLTLEPFGHVAKSARRELEAEAERLARLIEPDAKDHAVAFAGG